MIAFSQFDCLEISHLLTQCRAVHAEVADYSGHHGQFEEKNRKSRDGLDYLDAFQPAIDHEDERGYAHEQPPEQLDADGRFVHVGIILQTHQRNSGGHGVRQSDKREADSHDENGAEDRTQGQKVHNFEHQRFRAVFIHETQDVVALENLQVESEAAESAEPDHAEQRREEQVDHDEFTKRTAVCELDQEQSDDGAERQPVHKPVHIPPLRP